MERSLLVREWLIQSDPPLCLRGFVVGDIEPVAGKCTKLKKQEESME